MGKKLDKVVTVLAKLTEIAHWIGAVSMVVGLVLTLVMGSDAVRFTSQDFGAHLATYGFEVEIISAAGEVNLAALRLFLVGSAVILSLMAMVFRNVYLIMKRSEHDTPFQKDNVRMVREIGIFLLAVPLMGLLLNVLLRLMLGVDAVETSEDLSSLLIGLVVLCLSRIFAQGMELEADVDGLL